MAFPAACLNHIETMLSDGLVKRLILCPANSFGKKPDHRAKNQGRLKPLKFNRFSFLSKHDIIRKIFQVKLRNGHRAIFLFSPEGKMDIQQILDKTLPGLGYELVDFELTAQGILRVFIDKEGGITVEDCATVSNHLSRLFMVEDVDYKNLEISSPGPRPPAEKKRQIFVRFAGQQAKIKTRLPIDGQKNFIGRIEACENDIVTLSFDGKTASIEINNIDKARLKPEFKF